MGLKAWVLDKVRVWVRLRISVNKNIKMFQMQNTLTHAKTGILLFIFLE